MLWAVDQTNCGEKRKQKREIVLVIDKLVKQTKHINGFIFT